MHRRSLEDEFADELRVHREFLEEDGIRNGLSSDEARRQAALRLGNGTMISERTRDAWSLGWLDAMMRDARYAARFLRRSPGFTSVAVISLALGIGANAAVFSVVDRLLLRPPPHVADVGTLYTLNVRRIYELGGEGPFRTAMMYPEVFALKETATSFADVVAFTSPSRTRLGRGPDAPRIKESLVTGDFFNVLGVRPALGRFFSPDDARPDASERAAVISHSFWERHYGGARSAIGERMLLSGVEVIVIGVAPAGFTGVELDAADVWMPLESLAPLRIKPDWKAWDGFGARAVVRLKDRVSVASADAEATLILRRLPERKGTRGTIEETVRLGSVIPGRGPAEQSAEMKVSTRLVVAAVLVLIAACANLTNLFLVRALTRRRELALRLAIGVSRRRLVGQLVFEALLVAALGGAVALLAAQWGGGVLRSLVFPQLQWASEPLDTRVLAFSLFCATVAALLAAIAPAIRMTRSDVALALRSAAPQLVMSTGRWRRSLLALQVALSVLLIVGAAAFGQSLRRAYEFDIGIDVDRVMIARLFLEEDSLNPAGRRRMLEAAMRRAVRLPGVERASIASRIPLAGMSAGRIWLPRGDSGFATTWPATPDLKATLGFRLVRGRWIAETDTRSQSTVIVTETMAKVLWPGSTALGECVYFGDRSAPCREVVGVVKDLRVRSIREDAPMAALLPTGEEELSELAAYLVIRTSGNPETLSAPLHNVLRDVRTDLATVDIRPLAQLLDYEYRPLRLGTAIFGSFALLAIILAGVGLFGILAFSVAQRTSELGIRSALGANAGNLVRLIVGEGLGIVAIGLLLGGLGSWYAGTAVQDLMFKTSVRSAVPFVSAAVLLAIVALCASAIPARRASRVDPAIALRAE